MAAVWSWVLGDNGGNSLAELSAAGRQIAFARNAFAEAQFTVSHEDDAATLLFSCYKNGGTPTLKAYRDRVLRFRGYLSAISDQSEETSLATCVFRSPFGRLFGDGSQVGRYTVPTKFSATDAGTIATSLLTAANTTAPTGLVPGSVTASKTRDRTYGYENVGQAIVNLTNVLDGFDFQETFIDGAGITLAQLDIAPSLGVTRTNARFEYGPRTANNVSALKRSWLSPINYATVFTSGGSPVTAINQASIDKYGRSETQETLSSVVETATAQDRANGLLRPNPVRTVTFTPDPVLAPEPWDDWFLGDTVHLYARRGALAEDVDVRINSFTVAIDDNGNEAMEIPDPTTPYEWDMIRSRVAVEVVS